MKNKEQIERLEEKIKKRDNLNAEIYEEFLVAIDAIEGSEEKTKRILGSDFLNQWTRLKITLKDTGDFYLRLEALKSLMNLMEYSEYLEAKNEQV